MGLVELQRVLARLYTDEIFRDRFWSEPALVGAEQGLSVAECTQLESLSRTQLTLFADSLRQKRLHAIGKLLPLTAETLAGELPKYFAEFAQSFLPSGSQKHQLDAVAFADFLHGRLVQGRTGLPPWLPEVVLYEARVVETHLPVCGLLVNLFHFPVWDPAALKAGQQIPLSLFLWGRLSPGHRWLYLRVSLPW